MKSAVLSFHVVICDAAMPHATAFAAMAFFLRFSGLMQSSAWIFILLLSVGALDELHQMFIPMREASVYDLYADVIGTMLGLWFARLLLMRIVTDVKASFL